MGNSMSDLRAVTHRWTRMSTGFPYNPLKDWLSLRHREVEVLLPRTCFVGFIQSDFALAGGGPSAGAFKLFKLSAGHH